MSQEKISSFIKMYKHIENGTLRNYLSKAYFHTAKQTPSFHHSIK